MTNARRRLTRSRFLCGIGLFVIGILIYAAWPGSQRYTVSPETTFFTAPLTADGKVDYVVALNRKLSEGVTPQCNACVDVWQAVGPRPEGENPPNAEYFEWLGIPCPPEAGAYLMNWETFQKQIRPEDDPLRLPFENDPLALVERPEYFQRWPWKTTDAPDVSAWLTANEKPLRAVELGSTKLDYFHPLHRIENGTDQGLFGTKYSHAQIMRLAPILLVTRAMRHLGDGRIEAAWSDLMVSHRMARLMQRGASIIEYLVGLAMETQTIQGEILFLNHAKSTPQEWSARLKQIQSLPRGGTTADKYGITERACFLDSMYDIVEFGFKRFQKRIAMSEKQNRSFLFRRSFDWDVANRRINFWIDRTVEAIQMEPYSARKDMMKERVSELKTIRQQYRTDSFLNEIGTTQTRSERLADLVIVLLLPSYSIIREAEDKLLQQRRNLEVGFALAIFKAETGSFPTVLGELTPKHLSAVPTDLFNEQPLHYEKTAEGYLLYSVGPNMVDDGGATKDDQPPGDDIRLRIPAVRPEVPKVDPEE
jgi:hypothetical protein